MCGICGAVALRSAPLAVGVERRVEAMLGALAHRGPDSAGLHATTAAVLGATRLAIRGIADGRQPLLDPASGVVAVCNGELDNHREIKGWLAERGRPVPEATDVAIIPGLYLELGDAFAERLVGAFAIALWDPRRKRLLLVRDRAGEKPLFFHCTAGEAHFATELAALTAFALPGGLDADALAHYLRFGCFAVPGTPLAGAEKVGPGERVAIDASGVRRERYWRWRGLPLHSETAVAGPGGAPAPRSGRPGTARPVAPAALDVMDELFRQAVWRQTDVEVPCGVFLSGGLDSSLVTAVARAVRPQLPLRAFSLRFEEASYDEGRVAEQVAASLGLAATPVWVHPEDFAACLPELVRMAGEPLADPAWVPAALLARRAAKEVRQVLVGEGGDELFGGYPTYSGVWLSERYARLPGSVKSGLARLIRALPPSDKKVTLSFLLKRFVEGADLEGLQRHLLWTSNIAPDILVRLGVPPGSTPGRLAPAVPPPGELLDRVQQHDLENSLAEGLLTKADRASMHYALELRAPFLDREVMEFAATLPPRERVSGFETKVFLKRYARRYLPRWVVHRRKRGLSVPLASWLRGPLAGWARDRLASGLLANAGVDEAAALALFEEHRRRERDHARALWTLVVLAEWLAWAQARGVLASPALESSAPLASLASLPSLPSLPSDTAAEPSAAVAALGGVR
ncbi:MAG TPA: asparagine synthase (glutamine-hydrolyzing) [Thermoanaerobaculia bacterium]|nr:asparagine synthase (glutamine-hydrolyzing) [Thermoanaerobaculia bacterium]